MHGASSLHTDEAMTALADRAADRAAKIAVAEAFRMLGIDVESQTSVDETRTLLHAMRERAHRRKEMEASIRKGAVHALLTGLMAALTGVVGYIWHARH